MSRKTLFVLGKLVCVFAGVTASAFVVKFTAMIWSGETPFTPGFTIMVLLTLILGFFISIYLCQYLSELEINLQIAEERKEYLEKNEFLEDTNDWDSIEGFNP